MAKNVDSETQAEPWQYTNDLYRAIGRIAVTSTNLDGVLTDLIDRFVISEVIWRIILGQSTDWSVQALKILLEETDPYHRIYPKAQHEKFLSLLNRVDQLREIRNRVIHGSWSDSRIMDEKTHPRPWGNADSNAVLFVFRGRNRRGYEEQEMTISDIDRLSDNLEKVARPASRLRRNARGAQAIRPDQQDLQTALKVQSKRQATLIELGSWRQITWRIRSQ